MIFSVIVPFLDDGNGLHACLASLFSQDLNDTEVIGVANGLPKEAVASLRERYPRILFIENEYNVGAARARNQAIEKAHGAWVVTLDCDVVLSDGFFDRVRGALARVPQRVGALQPKVLSADGRTLFTTGVELSVLRRFEDRGRGSADLERFDRAQPPFGACSAAAVYRRSMLEDVRDGHGYFDERFFFLVEDVDLAWRARKAGWHTHYCPEAVCRHTGNSSRTSDPLRQYLCYRNRKLMIRKNESFTGRCLGFLASPFYDLPRALWMMFRNPYFFRPPVL